MTAAPGGRPLRVLVADDDVRVRAGLQRLLASAGVEVVALAATLPEAYAAMSGAEAVGAVDVALVDVGVPTTGAGLALIRDLATVVPVIALSINGAARAEALAAGAHAYLEKDGAPDQLVGALRAAARSTSTTGSHE